ncbi:MAG: hypothetical protein HQL70_05485, partial [Magnetococcales bacterium]|nr:hypothetical protein [Magnetococcales bacterium]
MQKKPQLSTTTQPQVSGGKGVLVSIFSRPPLAAMLVGGAIHLFSYFNAIFVGHDYISELVNSLYSYPVYGTGKLLIPFFVPWIVTSTACKIAQQRSKNFFSDFPDMNPDLIFKIDQGGSILYVNPSVRHYLLSLGLEEGRPQDLLPEDFLRTVAKVVGRDERSIVSHNIAGVSIDYTFRGRAKGDSVFVSGRDNTKLHIVQHRLNV